MPIKKVLVFLAESFSEATADLTPLGVGTKFQKLWSL